MKMNVPEFLNEFIMAPMPIEVHISDLMIYVGSPTNWKAFNEHLKAFKDTEVVGVRESDGKLIIDAKVVA